MQTGALRRAPPPFAGNDLVGVVGTAHCAHQDRLDDAALLHRRRQLRQLGFRKGAAGIARIGRRNSIGRRRCALRVRSIGILRRHRRSARPGRARVAIALRHRPSLPLQNFSRLTFLLLIALRGKRQVPGVD
jgi:hypothetical protein